MPDTGFMSPDNVVAQNGVFFQDKWINEGGGIIVFFAGSSNFQTVDGFENDGTLPAGATIVGAEVKLLETYSSPDGQTFDIQLSIDGGSNFSSAITSGNLGTSSGGSGAGADHLVPTSGGATQLWGLDWSGFSDLSQIQLKGSNGTQNIVSDHVQLKLYYTEAASPDSIKLNGGIFTIRGGTITIK